MERRQAEVIQSIRRISEEKRRALEDQLALIDSERSLVREQCERLNTLVSARLLLFVCLFCGFYFSREVRWRLKEVVGGGGASPPSSCFS